MFGLELMYIFINILSFYNCVPKLELFNGTLQNCLRSLKETRPDLLPMLHVNVCM